MKPTPTEYIRQTKENYQKLGFEPYQWFHADREPDFANLTKPLSQSKVGLISTAGTYVHGQVSTPNLVEILVHDCPRSLPRRLLLPLVQPVVAAHL